MSRIAASAGTASDGPRVCTACSLLCDDIRLTGLAADRACAAGAAAFAAALACGDGAPGGWIGGSVASREAALDRAATALHAARRVLVTGLAGGTLEAIARACDLAEAIGAAVDAGGVDSARAAGPTIARIGAVTADWEELRDRADLVIFWFSDPTATHPRFLERFVQPPPLGGPRRTIAIGPEPVLPPGSMHAHHALPAALAVEAARLLQATLTGRADDPPPRPVSEPWADVATAIAAASCVGIVTGQDEPGDVGLAAWSVAGLVRSITREKPAFQVPLAAGVNAGGGNLAGASAVCTWRYGAAGAISRADRGGAEFLPGESAARHLIRRSEVDCVLAVGDLLPAVEEEIAARRDGLVVVRLTAGCTSVASASPHAIQVRCASPLVFPAGTMLREDGRQVLLGGAADETSRPDSLPSLLAALLARMRGTPTTSDGGPR